MKYKEEILENFVAINPAEKLSKGTVATEISMTDIEPFQKYLPNTRQIPYKGGMKFKNGDTIMARITPCLENGKTAYVDTLGDDEIGFGSTEYIVFRAKDGKADPDFLYYLVRSPGFRDEAIALMTGTSGRQRVQTNALARKEFCCPPIVTQQKIASILSSLDDKIRVNNRMNKQLHEICALLFQECCIDGQIAKLGALLSEVESGSRQKGGAVSYGIPSIGAEKIERLGQYDFSSEKYISQGYFSKMKRGKIKNGDVLLYKDGAYTGKSSMVLDGFPHEQAAVNEHVFILRAKKRRIQPFLYFCIHDENNRNKLYTLACGKAAQPGLNQVELGSIEIILPTEDKILKFGERVEPMLHTIISNAKENEKLSQLRNALLPQLMSGKINVDKIAIEETR